jgi:hypothetical protein
LHVGEAFEGAGEGRGELNSAEGVEGGREVPRGFSEAFALLDYGI